jgi:hypothetical protein
LPPAFWNLTNSNWNREELSDQSKEFIIIPIRKKGDIIDAINIVE